MKNSPENLCNMMVNKIPMDTEIDELKELLEFKRKITKINDQIHDKAAAIATRQLAQKYPHLFFRFRRASESGFDIGGYDNPQMTGEPHLVAEVKMVTVTPPNKYLTNKQMEVILEDLERLLTAGPVVIKYLVIQSEDIKDDILREFDFSNKFSGISLLSIF